MPPPTGSTAISRYRAGKLAEPGAVGMLLEGDSWFAFPLLLRTNVTEVLKDVYDDKIVQLPAAKIGDEARAMMCGKSYAYLLRVLAREKLSFDCILFSGGGNDLVDVNLPALLNRYQPGDTWEDCLNLPRFQRRLQQIESAYLDLADLRDDYQPQAWIFSHGYDYATPSGKGVRILGLEAAGGWIKEQMDAKGLPPKIQQEVLNQMLSQFDNVLLKLEQTQKCWRHVRTQGTLKDSEWGDELHPTTTGFKKITAKFQTALADVFPSLSPA